MATHSSILAWRLPMDGGAWGGGGYSPWGRMESDTTELLSSSSIRVPQAWTWFVGVLSLPVTSDSR